VPTIVDDGFVLWESNSITRYLAARHAYGTLYPEDLRVRADGERWMDWQLTIASPAMVPVFWGLVRTPPEKRDNAAIEEARKKLSGVMGILDAHLKDRKFMTGDAFTVGDIPLGIAAYRWFNMEMKREDHPNLRRWYDLLTGRKPFQEHIMQPME
jgi:glutathione S-transferase